MPPGREAGKPKVVATFSVLGDLVHNVAGDQVDLVTLVGPDGDAHTFEPAPTDGVALAKADLLFENGAGLEPWLDGLYKSSQSKARRIVVSKGLKLIEADEDEHDHTGSPEEGCQRPQARRPGPAHLARRRQRHAHRGGRSATNWRSWTRRTPKSTRPTPPPTCNNSKTSTGGWYKPWRRCPNANRKLVTSHDTFGYFARRYGFQVLGSGLESVSTEASDPSAADFAKLVDAIKAAKVPAIFAENVQNPKLMQRLAKEAGVRLGARPCSPTPSAKQEAKATPT